MKSEPVSRCVHDPKGWLARPEIATQLFKARQSYSMASDGVGLPTLQYGDRAAAR